MPDGSKGLRELPVDAAQELPGLWVPIGFGDARGEPPTPLGWHLLLDDAALLGRALAERGASLPRLSRRIVRVDGHGYQAFAPLSRAARSLAPLDASNFARAVASEARGEASRLGPERAQLSGLRRGQLLVHARRSIAKLERAVFRHERDAAQHYRWLVEMDLGILPDDALGTTLEECVAIQRATRGFEIEATLELLTAYAVLSSYAASQTGVSAESLTAAALVPDALELPSATPALALACVAEVGVKRRALGAAARSSGVLREFLDGFGERGPSELEPATPRWRDRPERVSKVGDLLARADPEQSERRLARARSEREEAVRRALQSLGPIDAALLRGLIANLQKLVILRSRLNLVRARTLSMLRTAVLDVDRRLARLIKSEPEAAFFLGLRELLDSTVRPRSELASIARERRAEWSGALAAKAPPALLGRFRHEVGSDRPLTGLGVGGVQVRGAAFVTSSFERALEMPARSVLVTRSLDVGWAPVLLGVAAVVTDAGGLTDEATIVASSLGVPLVVGTVDGTRRIADGTELVVDTRAGSVAFAEPL